MPSLMALKSFLFLQNLIVYETERSVNKSALIILKDLLKSLSPGPDTIPVSISKSQVFSYLTTDPKI
jgi:hypothetical protein